MHDHGAFWRVTILMGGLAGWGGCKSDGHAPASPPEVDAGPETSDAALDTVADTDGGSDGDSGSDAGNHGILGDTCSETPCRMRPPDLTNAVDVETFVVPDEPALDRLVPAVEQVSGHLTVPPDVFQARLPPCRFPVRMNDAMTLTPTLDGSLAEWKNVPPVIVDREGDLAGAAVSYDLLRVYHAVDSAAHYFAFTFQADWPDGEVATLELDFAHVDLPQTRADALGSVSWHQYVIANGVVYDMTNGTAVSLLTSQFSVAGQGRTMEVRISRDALGAALGGEPWTLIPRVFEVGDAANIDTAGAYWWGLTTDYGCLVPLPGKRSKLFVFRRAPGVEAEHAEVIDRAVIAAAPWVEAEAKDTYDYVDTVDVTSVPDMAMAGYHWDATGLFIAVQTVQNLLTEAGVAGRFTVAAHEYGHGLNSDDYRLPRKWQKEGHSESVARRASADALGAGAAQYARWLATQDFPGVEGDTAAVSLDAEPWPQPNRNLDFHYAKAAGFAELLPTVVSQDAVYRLLRQGKLGQAPYADGPSFLAALTAQPEFSAPVTSGMWNGWFTSDYAGALFARTSVGTDTDHDGLFDYQERILGLNPEAPDSDHDGMSDAFELGAGTDPMQATPVTTLVMDGLLDDWQRLAPGLLVPASPSRSGEAACAGAPSMLRVGTVYDGQWLGAAVELSAAPTDPTFSVVVLLEDQANDEYWEFMLDDANPALYGFHGQERTRHVLGTAPFRGTQAELFYDRNWFGWSDPLPEGLTVRIVTLVGSGTLVECEITPELTLSRNLP